MAWKPSEKGLTPAGKRRSFALMSENRRRAERCDIHLNEKLRGNKEL